VLKGTSTMAGSCTNQLEIFYRLINFFGVSVENAVQMLSHNPAKIANLDNIGSIKEGNRADFILFDDKFQLKKTIIAGKIVFKTE